MSPRIILIRPRKLRRIVIAAAVGGSVALTGVGWAVGPARADGVISNVEAAYVTAYGASAVCPTIDEYPSTAGVLGVMRGIMDDGFTADSAVDVINASVSAYCPRWWPLLQRIGDQARGETASAVVKR